MAEEKKLIFVAETVNTSFIYYIAHYLATMNLKFIINIIIMLRNIKGLEKTWEEIKKKHPKIEKNMYDLMKRLDVVQELRKTIDADTSRNENKYDKLLASIYAITPAYNFELMDAFWLLVRETELVNTKVSNNLIELASKNELSIKKITGESRRPYFEQG